MTAQLDTGRLVAAGIGFGEGPRWYRGALWFSDIARGNVCRVVDDPGSEAAVEVIGSVPGSPSGLGWLPDGTLLAVSMHGRAVYLLDADQARVHADLSDLVPADLNDMVVAPDGTAYVTGFGYDAAAGEERAPTGVCLCPPRRGGRDAARRALAAQRLRRDCGRHPPRGGGDAYPPDLGPADR